MARKHINMTTYPRIDHFKHFLSMDEPMASVTVQVDVTDFVPRLKAAGRPFFLSFQYCAVRAANRIPEVKTSIPVTLLINHALIDGIHIGQFYRNLEDELRSLDLS